MLVEVERTIRRTGRDETIISLPVSWKDPALSVGRRVVMRYDGATITITPVPVEGA